MTKNKLIGFDGDCTLYDTSSYLVSNTFEAYQNTGHNIGKIAILSTFEEGHSLKEVFRRLTPEADADVLEKLFYEADEANGIDNVRLYPGVIDCLTTLTEKGYQLGIVTSRTQASTRTILEHLGIIDFFRNGRDKIIGADDVVEPKPSPEGIQLLMEQTSVSTERTYFVGDTPGDILAGINAGVTPIGFTRGFGSSEKLRRSGASVLFENHYILPQIIK